MYPVQSRTGVQYDMHDPESVIQLIEDNDWNSSQASRDIGRTKHCVRNWTTKHGLKDRVTAGRQAYLMKAGRSIPLATDNVKARQSEARHREVLRLRRDAQAESTEEAEARVGREKIMDALVSSFGVVRDAADLVNVKRAVLLKMVASDPDLMAAALQGEREMRLDMRDKMILAAQGRIALSRDESSWMERLARWERMDGSGEKGGLSPDMMAGMPEEPLEVTDLDLPDFSVPESALANAPDLTH